MMILEQEHTTIDENIATQGQPEASSKQENYLSSKLSFINKQKLPAILYAKDVDCDLHTLITQHRDELKEIQLTYGAILFRGFPIKDGDDLSAFSNLYFDNKAAESYMAGGSPRIKVKNNVFNSTYMRPSYRIRQHSEMSYVSHYPHEIMFFCETPAASGGETPLTDTRQIYKHLDPKIRQELEDKGVQYNRYFWGKKPNKLSLFGLYQAYVHLPRCWRDAFETDSKESVEQACRDGHFTPHWFDDDGLVIQNHLPAVRKHPITQEKVWFNQSSLQNKTISEGWKSYYFHEIAFAFDKTRKPYTTLFGDGSTIPKSYIHHIESTINSLTVYYPWQKGDLLLLDNLLTCHGRMPFKGDRKILVSMK